MPYKAYAETDILIVGPDRVTTRIFGNRLALKLKKPALFPAAGIDVKNGKLKIMGGSVQVVIPKRSACYECVNQPSNLEIMRETLDEKRRKILSQKYSLGNLLEVTPTPSIVCLNGVIASLTVWEVVKVITKIQKPIYFQVYDAISCKIKRLEVQRDPNCPACGKIKKEEVGKIEKLAKLKEELSRWIS